MDQLQPQMPLTQGPVSQPPVTNPPDKSPLAPFSMGKPKGKSKLLFAIIGIVAVLGIGIYIFVGNSSLFTGKLVVGVVPKRDVAIDLKIDTGIQVERVQNEFEQACTSNCGTWDPSAPGACTTNTVNGESSRITEKRQLDVLIGNRRDFANGFKTRCDQNGGQWDESRAPCAYKCTYWEIPYESGSALATAVNARHSAHFTFEQMCTNQPTAQWDNNKEICTFSGSQYTDMAALRTAIQNVGPSNRAAFRTAL